MLEGKDILIVEDDPVFRNMVASFLRGQGCEVVEAENGIEGLKASEQQFPISLSAIWLCPRWTACNLSKKYLSSFQWYLFWLFRVLGG